MPANGHRAVSVHAAHDALEFEFDSHASDIGSRDTSVTRGAQELDHEVTVSAVRHVELVPDCFGATRKQ